MSRKITNEVLAEKIDNLHETLTNIKSEVSENTKFRLQFKGFISGLIALSGLLGGLIAWAAGRLVR